MSGLTREQRVAGVHALLGPSNIAIVGASDRPGSWSGGVWRALRRLLTIPDGPLRTLARGPRAIVGQSGGIIMALYRALASRAVAVSYALTSGNEIGLCTADYIRYLVDDPDIKVIGCFIEAIRRADEFKNACEYARAAGEPIVAVKIGGSPETRRATLAPYGALPRALACLDSGAST